MRNSAQGIRNPINDWNPETQDQYNPKHSGVVAVDSCFVIIVTRQNGAATDRTRKLCWENACSLWVISGVVFMSFKVNFDVGRSAVQIAMCLPGIFLLIRSSLDSSFSGIFVCGPLFIWNPESKFHRQGIPNQSVELRIRDCHGAKSPFRNSKGSFKETHPMSDPFKDSGISTHPSTNPKLTLITTCLRQNVELGEG